MFSILLILMFHQFIHLLTHNLPASVFQDIAEVLPILALSQILGLLRTYLVGTCTDSLLLPLHIVP